MEPADFLRFRSMMEGDDVLADLLDRPAWHARAACRGRGPDLWFPERHAPADKLREARAICSACPVSAECLDYALSVDVSADVGLWGGLSQRQRQRLRRTAA